MCITWRTIKFILKKPIFISLKNMSFIERFCPKLIKKKLTLPSTVTADFVAWQPFDAINNTGSELSYILVYCGTVCVILESFQKHFLFGIIQNWNPSKKKAKQNFKLKIQHSVPNIIFLSLCKSIKKGKGYMYGTISFWNAKSFKLFIHKWFLV